MILRRNQDLFNTIKALAGVNDFTDNEITDLVSFTNRRLTMAYNTTPMWERYVVVSEERQLAVIKVEGADVEAYNGYYIKNGETSNAAQSTFADADVFVKSDNKDYVFYKTSGNQWNLGVSDTAFTNTPITDITTFSNSSPTSIYRQDSTDEGNHNKPSGVQLWVGTGLVNTNKINLVVSDVSTILYESLDFPILDTSLTIGNENVIQDFIRIHRTQSFLNRSATEYDFYVDVNGANVLNSSATDGKVFVTYKKPIVDTTTGQIITSLDTTATSNYVTQIPLEFFNYTAHGVYADFLRMDGQHDKAAFEEQKADMFLATELERIDIINNNNSLNHKFSTYVNTSSR